MRTYSIMEIQQLYKIYFNTVVFLYIIYFLFFIYKVLCVNMAFINVQLNRFN